MVCCFGGVVQSVTPPLIPGPLSLLSAVLAGGKVVAWLATSPPPSEIRTPLHNPSQRGREAVEMKGQRIKGERGENRVMMWEEGEMKLISYPALSC